MTQLSDHSLRQDKTRSGSSQTYHWCWPSR